MEDRIVCDGEIGEPLPQEFYLQETLMVARHLLGTRVVRRLPTGEVRMGTIVETEAYAQDDPAMWAYRKPTVRNRIMFGPPGRAYLYFTYRLHLMFNIVCAPEGIAESVLIRALDLGEGLGLSANGPGRLTAALGLTGALNGINLTDPGSELQIVSGEAYDFEVATATRIGLSRGADLPRRFYVRSNPSVSRLVPAGLDPQC